MRIWTYASFGLALCLTSSAWAGISLFKLNSRMDAGYERLSSKDSSHSRRPRLKTRRLIVTPSSRDLIGLRFTGALEAGTLAPSFTRLALPLSAPVASETTFTFHVEVGLANESPFTARTRGEFSHRAKVAALDIDVHAWAGDKVLYVQDFLNPGLSAAIAGHPGSVQNLSLYLRMTSSHAATSSVHKDVRLRKSPRLEICNGPCSLVDLNGDSSVTISCLGDSNTGTAFLGVTSWCNRLNTIASALGWKTINHGVPSTGIVSNGTDQMTSAVNNDHPDAVVIAYGTNDNNRYTEEQILAAYDVVIAKAQSYGARAYIALAPPSGCWAFGGLPEDPVVPLNEGYRAHFPPEILADFYSIIGPADFLDCVHMNDAGQQKRAEEAFRVLSAQ